MRLTTGHASELDAEVAPRVSWPWALAVTGLALAGVFWLDRATDRAPFQHLYYAPIVFSAIRFGRRGAVISALAAIVLYHLANPHLLTFHHEEGDIVQILLFAAVGIVAGRFAEDARRFHRLAMTDDLTGLHNLRSFERRLTLMIEWARRTGGEIALIVIDLDRLKSLNDVHGHLAGAEAVRTVGHIMADRLPPEAVACRYGGDEFVVALPGASDRQARAVAEDLRRAVQSVAPVLAGKAFPAGTISVSAGVAARRFAIASETAARAGEALFGRADAALYAAKHAGRNGVHVA